MKFRSQRGSLNLELALLIMLLILVCVIGLSFMGLNISNIFQRAADMVTAGWTGGGGGGGGGSNPSSVTGTTLAADVNNFANVLSGFTATDDVGVTGFEVEKDGTIVANIPFGTASWTDNFASYPATYRLRAYDDDGNYGPWSNPITINRIITLKSQDAFDRNIPGGILANVNPAVLNNDPNYGFSYNYVGTGPVGITDGNEVYAGVVGAGGVKVLDASCNVIDGEVSIKRVGTYGTIALLARASDTSHAYLARFYANGNVSFAYLNGGAPVLIGSTFVGAYNPVDGQTLSFRVEGNRLSVNAYSAGPSSDLIGEGPPPMVTDETITGGGMWGFGASNTTATTDMNGLPFGNDYRLSGWTWPVSY